MRLDLWDARGCGLVDDGVVGLLDGVGPTAGGPAGPGGAVTYLVGLPEYEPYRSARLPRPAGGLAAARRVLEVFRSVELRECAVASPLAGVARGVASAVAAVRGGDGPVGRGLALAASVVPRKGGEVGRLWEEYRRRVPGATEPGMAVRDLWGSAYAWQFIRADGRVLDVCGSLLALTSAVDYCGAPDDPGAGARWAYAAVASEGLELLSGPAVARAVLDVAAVGGLMALKDGLPAPGGSGAGRVRAGGRGPSGVAVGLVDPAGYALARAWDGAVGPYLRLPLGTGEYRRLAGAEGEFRGFSGCRAIRRAVENIVRYNDITDAVTDFAHGESFNEVNLALALGGASAITGFGAALAELTDAALECGCGADGHEEAAEVSMGAALWYLLMPRYLAGSQFAAFRAAGGEVARAYRVPAARERSAGCSVVDADVLFDVDWSPLWVVRADPVGLRAERVARRAVLPGGDGAGCAARARDVLARCGEAEPVDLREVDWPGVFDAALDAAGAPPAPALRELVAVVWRQVVLGEEVVRDARLLVDVDVAVRDSYAAPGGLAARRAFFGVLSGAVELAGLNPYGRLADGLAALCR
ncbi:hypothetical protein [Actinosynnema mirum]|uniref:Uncharacterized protein n=1 Tax=Actinosynnema mirum (strain ATCC 29888 / DSM 43827 / JCM 3225 / NBRC 14064 / NCIMB 13271 / NRRL B-12336 / IMRU 3971 / 101) TaxID=446462 RepID=C6WPG0_ACTMD|nr:hypothetical protein [Actinosynnema mirum]ACU38662.1 hypothetical protein Amir_4835 [Actinosynnema mirum DSM 43827]